ncbi:MAG: hypothetical protein KDC34_09395 [Saprospiraceae bacterium]|nr:hypothetical protein [Saprospiraceae bacterium]
MKTALLLLSILSTFGACDSEKPDCTFDKIKFDLELIDEVGLRGPKDGKVLVDYEFCIPQKDAFKSEVVNINPYINMDKYTKGRIGCSDKEWHCMGNTGSQNYREILCALSNLDYVVEIREVFFE